MMTIFQQQNNLHKTIVEVKIKGESQQKQTLHCLSLEDPVNCEDSQQKRNNASCTECKWEYTSIININDT